MFKPSSFVIIRGFALSYPQWDKTTSCLCAGLSNPLCPPQVDSAFAAIEQNNLPFDLMIAPHQLKHACHLAFKHPKLKLVLNHCGMPLEFTSTHPGAQQSSVRHLRL